MTKKNLGSPSTNGHDKDVGKATAQRRTRQKRMGILDQVGEFTGTRSGGIYEMLKCRLATFPPQLRYRPIFAVRRDDKILKKFQV